MLKKRENFLVRAMLWNKERITIIIYYKRNSINI